MDLGIIITAGIGIIVTFCSSLITWLFSRKKYNAEVDSNTIQNLSSSIEVYKTIVTDLEKKIDFYIEVSEENKLEVIKLKGIVYRLINKICLDHKCSVRKMYTKQEVEEIMGIINNVTKPEKN